MLSHEENNIPFEYQTGSVPPARQAGGVFAAGVFIIFAVLGLFIVTGVIGYRVFAPNTTPVIASLSHKEGNTASPNGAFMEGDVLNCQTIGITCQSISNFCAEYYSLPKGVYVVSVEKNTPADQQGILPGDVLIAINDDPTSQAATLQNYVENNSSDDPVYLLFVRGEQEFSVFLSPEVFK